jgi:hypothetical protein
LRSAVICLQEKRNELFALIQAEHLREKAQFLLKFPERINDDVVCSVFRVMPVLHSDDVKTAWSMSKNPSAVP